MEYAASWLLSGFVLAAWQADPSRQVPELIESLTSGMIEEREEAAHELKKLGKIAVAPLERAARGSESESALRAQEILREITAPQPGSADLVLRIRKDGICTANGKTFANLARAIQDACELRKLSDLFESRRQQRQSGGVEYHPRHVAYTLFLEADADTPFEYVRIVLKLAADEGAVQKTVLLAGDEFARLKLGRVRDELKGPQAPAVRLHARAAGGRRFLVGVENVEIGELAADETSGNIAQANGAVVSRGIAKVCERLQMAPAPKATVLEVDGTLPVTQVIRFLALLSYTGMRQLEIAGVTKVLERQGR